MRRSISRVAFAVTALTVALAVAAAVVGITLSLDAERASTSDLNTYIPAGEKLNQLLAVMVDQESGERGYVITAQARFLQPYLAGERSTGQLVAELRHDLASDAAAKRLLHRVVTRYTVWLHTFAQPQIADVQSGDGKAAVQAEKTGRGKALFDSLRGSVGRLGSLINSREVSKTDRVKSLQQAVVWLVVGIVVCAVVGSVIGYRLLRRWITEPIRSLERSVLAASREDAVIMASGPVEIASLGVSVETMRKRIGEQGLELYEHRHVVSVLQEALLPRRLPKFEGFEFTSRYLPAAIEVGIGGDWFNIRPVEPHRLFVAVGDVSGKGVDAAARMASLRFAVNAFASENPDPGSVLTRLSRLVNFGSTDRFATVVACVFDAVDRELLVASAGHLSPLRLSADGSSVLEVVPGPPIGLRPTVYSSVAVPLPPDATVVLFSDGLVERRGERLDENIERLTQVVAPQEPLEQLIDGLIVATGTNRTDDTIVCGVRISEAARERAVANPEAGYANRNPGTS
jgi:serine phosphatase RsbU (regulator of sigma subunit)/CHASE3 domain sensor protein